MVLEKSIADTHKLWYWNKCKSCRTVTSKRTTELCESFQDASEPLLPNSFILHSYAWYCCLGQTFVDSSCLKTLNSGWLAAKNSCYSFTLSSDDSRSLLVVVGSPRDLLLNCYGFSHNFWWFWLPKFFLAKLLFSTMCYKIFYVNCAVCM